MARRIKRQRAKGPGFVESGLITELPSDTMRLILEKLDSPKDIAALLMASRSFQQSTMAALPPQQRLWYGARLGQLQHVESALKEGARVNKLDQQRLWYGYGYEPYGRNPGTLIQNALRTIRSYRRSLTDHPTARFWRPRCERLQQVDEFLISQGAKAFDQDTLNEELCDIVGNSDPPSAQLLRVKEAILDGADMHARLQYGKYQPYSSALGNMAPTMEKMDIMRFAICKAKLEPSVYIPWIKTLLECGYDVNKSAQDSTFTIARITTPLMDAIDVKRTGPFYVDLDEVLNPVAQYQPGGDSFTNFNATDGVRRRDLYFANRDTSEVVGSRIEILKVLLNAPNADVNKLNNGFTVLHYLQLPSNGHDHSSFPMDDGLRQENIALARLLLQAGADVSILTTEDSGGTAVDMAESNLHSSNMVYHEWTEYLQTMLNVLKGAEEARDGFIRAVEVNDVDSVQQHIARGAPVNTMFEVRDLPTTPLHLAIYNCYVIYCGPGVLEALLAAPNINVNVQGYFVRAMYGELSRRGTPLHYAVEINEVECVRALLEVPGVDVNAKTDDDDLPVNNKFAGLKETPLHMAACDSRVDIIHALLSAPNINVNECSHDKITALHDAAFNGEFEAVKALLSAPNIDVNSRDYQGFTPLHLAVEEKHDDVMMALLSAPNIDVNIRSDKGETALQLAHESGRVEAVRTLLSSPNIDIDSEPPHIRDAVQKRLGWTK